MSDEKTNTTKFEKIDKIYNIAVVVIMSLLAVLLATKFSTTNTINMFKAIGENFKNDAPTYMIQLAMPFIYIVNEIGLPVLAIVFLLKYIAKFRKGEITGSEVLSKFSVIFYIFYFSNILVCELQGTNDYFTRNIIFLLLPLLLGMVLLGIETVKLISGNKEIKFSIKDIALYCIQNLLRFAKIFVVYSIYVHLHEHLGFNILNLAAFYQETYILADLDVMLPGLALLVMVPVACALPLALGFSLWNDVTYTIKEVREADFTILGPNSTTNHGFDYVLHSVGLIYLIGFAILVGLLKSKLEMDIDISYLGLSYDDFINSIWIPFIDWAIWVADKVLVIILGESKPLRPATVTENNMAQATETSVAPVTENVEQEKNQINSETIEKTENENISVNQ